MNFNLANNGPIDIKIDGKPYSVPRFKRKDWLKWGAEIDAERVDQATAGMDAGSRCKFLMLYPPAPVDEHELSRRIQTTAGKEYLLRICLKRASVPDDEIEKLLEQGEPEGLRILALWLASLIDPARMAAPSQPEGEEGEVKGEEPPLPSTGTASNG